MEQPYRCEASSLEGFVSQVVRYITKGYRYYVTGIVPDRVADPRLVDQKLIAKYEINLPKWTRARRRKLGYANLQYLRYGRFWVIFATPGRHLFHEEEANNIRDIWKTPLRLSGYSISYKPGGYLRKKDKGRIRTLGTNRWEPREPLRVDPKRRAHVRLDLETYQQLREYFLMHATHRSRANLERMFFRIPFEPYAPVREQVKRILIQVNKSRRRAGYERIPYTALRYRRRVSKVFEEPSVVAPQGRLINAKLKLPACPPEKQPSGRQNRKSSSSSVSSQPRFHQSAGS